jgi:phage baseplate assembly protein gpV
MSYHAAEADRRIANMFNVGVVTALDAGATAARVRIGDLVTPPLPVMALRAGGMQVWWMPTAGEQVVVAAPSGDLAQGVIVGSIHAGNAPGSDPDVPVIDLRGGKLEFRGDIEMTGKLTVTGPIDVTGDVTCDADVVASGISLTTHIHGGVIPGGGSTGGPQ